MPDATAWIAIPLEAMFATDTPSAPALCWRGADDTWEIYPGEDGWRWRRTTANGEFSERSGCGHPRKRDCFADALAHGMRCAPMERPL